MAVPTLVFPVYTSGVHLITRSYRDGQRTVHDHSCQQHAFGWLWNKHGGLRERVRTRCVFYQPESKRHAYSSGRVGV